MEKKNEYVVLVVEDEKPLLAAIRKKLEINNFSVVTARKAEQGISYLKELDKVDAIWVDHYLLGDEDGLDFVAKIKSDEELKKIPVFVVSNTATPDKVHSYINLGAEKYYVKADYRLEDIVTDIRSFLEKGEE